MAGEEGEGGEGGEGVEGDTVGRKGAGLGTSSSSS